MCFPENRFITISGLFLFNFYFIKIWLQTVESDEFKRRGFFYAEQKNPNICRAEGWTQNDLKSTEKWQSLTDECNLNALISINDTINKSVLRF